MQLGRSNGLAHYMEEIPRKRLALSRTEREVGGKANAIDLIHLYKGSTTAKD